MNKIYNNLSIENLTKTEWFNQFNINQQEEILKGLENNLDVSVYAKTEFDWTQMRNIMMGLKANLDVSWYAKKEFNFSQMNQIMRGLIKKLDVSIYAKKEFDWSQMEQIRLGLEDNLDVFVYAKLNFNKYQMEQIRLKLQKESTLSKCTLFLSQKNSFLKMFSFAQNRFQIFDVDISMFVVPENSSKISKNASHV